MNFELKTERLLLEPFEVTDINELHHIFTDPQVREFLWDDALIPESRTAEILKENKQQFQVESCGLWKVVLGSQIIGFAGLWYFFDETQPQLLYGLLPEYSGSGYATEASRAITNYAFDILNFEYLIAATDEPHKASRKLLERLGYRLEEVKEIDHKSTAFYRIDKTDWKNT